MLTKVHSSLVTTEDIPSQALLTARRQDLQLAEKALNEISRDLRDMSSVIFTVNTSKILKLKHFIRTFRKEIMHFAESDQGNEVYKLNVQFFPLTQLKEPSLKKVSTMVKRDLIGH